MKKFIVATLVGIVALTIVVSDGSANGLQPMVSSSKTEMIAYNSGFREVTSPSELEEVLSTEWDVFSNHISVYYTGDMTNIMEVMENIFDQYVYENDYFRGIIYKWNYGYKGNILTFDIEYLTTEEQEAFIQSEVERIVHNIITPAMSDVEKVKAIHDYVILNSTYSYNTNTSPHAAYSILKEGKGVCSAYAMLTQRLLEEAGMEVRYVTGYTSELHAWNLVKVDEEWYHLDTTWDDPTFDASAGDQSNYVQYDYFLISDKEMSKDHKIDTKSDYPKATSERFVNVRGVSEPIQMNGQLYYPNTNDDIKLYTINLQDSAPQAKNVSNTRVKHLFSANDWLYFSNYSNRGYLYKMKLDGSEETLLVKSDVTDIKREGDQVVVYSGDSIIYTEEIK